MGPCAHLYADHALYKYLALVLGPTMRPQGGWLKALQKLATAMLLSTFIVSFAWHNILFIRYQRDNPHYPIPDQGFVYPLANHGAIVYITAAEHHQLQWLWRIDEWIMYPYILLVMAPAAWRGARARRGPKRPR